MGNIDSVDRILFTRHVQGSRMSRSLSYIMFCDGIEERHVHETLEFASKGTKVGFLRGEMIDDESRGGKFFSTLY